MPDSGKEHRLGWPGSLIRARRIIIGPKKSENRIDWWFGSREGWGDPPVCEELIKHEEEVGLATNHRKLREKQKRDSSLQIGKE